MPSLLGWTSPASSVSTDSLNRNYGDWKVPEYRPWYPLKQRQGESVENEEQNLEHASSEPSGHASDDDKDVGNEIQLRSLGSSSGSPLGFGSTSPPARDRWIRTNGTSSSPPRDTRPLTAAVRVASGGPPPLPQEDQPNKRRTKSHKRALKNVAGYVQR